MDTAEVFVHMAVSAWRNEIKATDLVLGGLSDDRLMKEVSTGRNRGIYLLGHLTAEHDLMLPLLRFQEALYPALKEPFIDEPDKAVVELPPLAQLRAQWAEVNGQLMGHIERMAPADWFTRHANISDADFPKEPHRNRLNVLISRTNHLAYHRGQLVLLDKR